MSIIPADDPPEGARPAGDGYWFTPMPVYLVDAVFNAASPVNAPAAMLWAHIHRHYAWRRRVFPSYATLAEETGQSESAVKRQLSALKAAGAITWGATYGAKGRSSNEYALAPVKPFDFDRQVEVKNDPHHPVEVRNDPGVEVKSDLNPQVKNDLGVKNTDEVRASLSPRLPKQTRRRPAAAPKERENSAAPQNHNPGRQLDKHIHKEAQQVAAAWTTARGGPRIRKTETTIAKAAADLLADGHDLDHLCRVAAWMASRNYLRLDDALTHPDAPKPAGATIRAISQPLLPDWCGQCADGNPDAATQPARRFINHPDGTSSRCHCHPAAARHAA